MTLYSDYFKAILEPSRQAERVRDLLQQAAAASLQEDSCKRRWDTLYCGSYAWIASVFDSFRFSYNGMTHAVTHIKDLDLRALMRDVKEDSCDVLQSIKIDVVLPFCLFAALFFPKEVFGRDERTGNSSEINRVEENRRESQAFQATLERGNGVFEGRQTLERSNPIIFENAILLRNQCQSIRRRAVALGESQNYITTTEEREQWEQTVMGLGEGLLYAFRGLSQGSLDPTRLNEREPQDPL